MYSYKLLLLNNRLYGEDESTRMLFEKLKYGLEDQNFEQIGYDLCMFISDKVICLVYADDFIWFTKYRNYIGEFIKYLQKKRSKYN